MGLFDIFTGDSAKEAAAKNAALYGDYGTQAQGYLDTALPQETGAVQSGINSYAPLAALGSQYSQAGTMLGNSLGLNGDAGTAAATDAFHAGPGYTFARDQGLDAINRSGAANGFSGNTMVDAAKYAAGYADQNFNNWQSNLSGLAGQGLSATAGAAQGQQTGYNALAGVYGNNASDRIGIAGNVASGTANSNTAAANSQMQASGNFWSSLMNLGGALGSGGLNYATGTNAWGGGLFGGKKA